MDFLHILQKSSIPDLMDDTSQFSFVNPWVPHRPWPGHHWGPKTWWIYGSILRRLNKHHKMWRTLINHGKRISPGNGGNGSWLGSNHHEYDDDGDHHFRSGKISTPRAWPSLHPGFMSMSTWEIQYSLGLWTCSKGWTRNNEFHIKKVLNWRLETCLHFQVIRVITK